MAVEEKQLHKVILNDRGSGLITGVKDVVNFDTNEILLETVDGMLTIKGQELHVTRLTVDKGEIELDGRVDSFTYSDTKKQQKSTNLISRLFK